MSNPYQAGEYSVVLAPDASSTAERTANLDCAGADVAMIAVEVSVEANTNSTNVVLSVLESDDTVVTNFATYNSAFETTIDNTAAAVHPISIDLRGRKRYQRISLTPDTTTNGAVLVSAVGILAKNVVTANA